MSGFDLRQAQGLAEAKAHRQHAESFRDPLLPQHIEDTADRRRTFGYDQAPCWICLRRPFPLLEVYKVRMESN